MQLQIVSQSPRFFGRVMRQYYLDGINTVGVFGQEEFAIRYVNGGERVQVKLSLDGTDVLTGGKADTSLSRMFVVEPHALLELIAWPETTEGGAAFIFTHAANAAAPHTHGDLTALGYISAAIFTEGYTPPQVVSRPTPFYGNLRGAGGEAKYLSAESLSGPGIGAGDYVPQQIGTAKGLIRPVYSHMLQVRYLWWDDVVVKLHQDGYTPRPSRPAHPTGFEPRRLANLGDTPRQVAGRSPVPDDEFDRFER